MSNKAYWTTKEECLDGNVVIFVDHLGNKAYTIVDAERSVNALKQGLQASDMDIHTIAFLSHYYSLDIAIDVVAGFKFGDVDTAIDSKFLLAPSVNEAIFSVGGDDSVDVKERLELSDISGNQFARVIEANKREMRHKLNEHKEVPFLTLPEKYISKIVVRDKDYGLDESLLQLK